MSFAPRRFSITLAICLAELIVAPSSAQTVTQSSRTKSTQLSSSARPSVKLDTLYQLCSLRQRELLVYAKAAAETTYDYLNAKDLGQKNRLMEMIRASREAGAQAEISWQRLGCFDLMYRLPQASGR